MTGALAQESFGAKLARGTREPAPLARVRAGDLTVRFTPTPPTIHRRDGTRRSVQRLVLDATRPGMSFLLPKGPLLGLGEGGVQFDRKGSTDQMRNGQGGYRLRDARHARADSVAGRHRRLGDVHPSAVRRVRLHRHRRQVHAARRACAAARRVRRRRRAIRRSSCASTRASPGLPEMPALWTFGYMQSPRTLAGPDEILGSRRRSARRSCRATR